MKYGEVLEESCVGSPFLVKSCQLHSGAGLRIETLIGSTCIVALFFEALSADGSRVVACPDKIQVLLETAELCRRLGRQRWS